MDIRAMHYDFKKKLNKLDSANYRNLLVPEVDWALNEAQDIIVKRASASGRLDAIRPLVRRHVPLSKSGGFFPLPVDYRHFISADAGLNREGCGDALARVHVRGDGRDWELDPFARSSYEWREVNAVLGSGGIRVYDDGTFTVDKLVLSYVRSPLWMHAAQDHSPMGYKMPSGSPLYGYVDCELPEDVHGQLVDLAVLVASGEIQAPDYQVKRDKIGIAGGF